MSNLGGVRRYAYRRGLFLAFFSRAHDARQELGSLHGQHAQSHCLYWHDNNEWLSLHDSGGVDVAAEVLTSRGYPEGQHILEITHDGGDTTLFAPQAVAVMFDPQEQWRRCSRTCYDAG